MEKQTVRYEIEFKVKCNTDMKRYILEKIAHLVEVFDITDLDLLVTKEQK